MPITILSKTSYAPHRPDYLWSMKSQIQAYFLRQLELLEAERTEDLRAYRALMEHNTLEERIAQGATWYPAVLKSAEMSAAGQFRLSIERTQHLGEPHLFTAGANVAISGEGNTQGVIVAIWEDAMRVAVDELPDWVDEGKLRIDLLFDNHSYREMEKALREMMNTTHPRTFFLREVLLGKQPPIYEPIAYPVEDPLLNPSQNQALRHCLSAQDIAIIHGPPGTGKTTTLVRCIIHELRKTDQVLVCAPSNVAVDLLALKLAQAGIRVVRLGNPARVSPELQCLTLDEQIVSHSEARSIKQLRKEAEEYYRLARKYKRNFGADEREQRKLLLSQARALKEEAIKTEQYLTDKILSAAQVIATTLVGASSPLLTDKMFSTVFIDEAAQALEPALWIAIAKAKRVIFAGDHHQLPPTVKSKTAEKEGFNLTLFEKCIQYHPQSASMLRTQYRMNSKIAGFSSGWFYEGQLQADESVQDHVLNKNHPRLCQALEFVDTAGCNFDEQSQGYSYFNPGEGRVIFAHLTQLLEALTMSEPNFAQISIALISPYKGQVNWLKEHMQADPNFEYFLPQITINSVDGFQGQEKDVVYLSLVRSNPPAHVGFLADLRRFNVAITRARKKLVVVGDSATLSQHKFYEAFLEYAEKQGHYQTAWEFIT